MDRWWVHVRMTGTGRLAGEEEFASSSGLKHFAVDVIFIIHTGTKERPCA